MILISLILLYFIVNDCKNPILFYDSYCLRCSRIVRWLLKNTEGVYFSSLKGQIAGEILSNKPPHISDESIIFFSVNHQQKRDFYDKIDAVSKVLSYSRSYRWLRLFIKLIPKPLANALYSLAAKLRKQQHCSICLHEFGDRIIP